MATMHAVEKTLRWIILLGIFIVPTIALIVLDNLFFPYITGKNFTYRIVVEIIAGAWLALAVCIPKYRPRRTWILGAFTLFVVVMAIADAQGVMPFKSFWSNYERMDGWITIAHTLLFLVVLASTLNTENLWRRFFQWSLAISALLSVLGLLQVVGIFTLGSGGTGLEGRVDATFGNPIYFAAYMLFHIFIAALLWYQMWQVRKPGSRLAPSIMYGVVIGFDTLTLLFSGTRGATLGLIGGAIVALFMFAYSKDASQKFRTLTVSIFAVLVILSGGLWLSRDTSFVKSVGFLERLASISLNDDTTRARLINISIAWNGIKERPILGWGQENYAIVFDKYYDARMYAQEPWFDRVHNIIFDWWVAGGTLGLLSYLSIFAATFYVVLRKQVFTSAERAILTGLLIGYIIHNLTVFDNVTSYILFAMILSYMCYRENLAHKLPAVYEGEIIPRKALPVVAAGAAVLVLWSAWAINARALAQNQTLIQAITPQSGNVEQNLTYFNQAIAYGSYGTQEVREQLAQAAIQVVASSAISNTTKVDFATTAIGELNKQAQSSPMDARFPFFAGGVLDAAGDYKDAVVPLERAQQLSPHKQAILIQLAQNAELLGDTPGSLAYFKQAFDLLPDDLDARLYYAAALIQAGQESAAQTILAPVISTGQAADTRIAQAYAARGEFSPMVPIWQAHVKADPTDMQAYFTLAAIYYSLHDTTDAISILKTAESLNVSIASQAEQLIQQIKSGTAKVN